MADNHNNESAQRFCASCGIPIDTTNQFCRKCGTKRKVTISTSTKITEPRKGDQKLFISIGTGAAIAAVAIIILFVFPFGPIKDTSNGDVNDDIITPIANVTESELLVNENNQFALDFYSKVANKDNNTNVFFSPWSIMNAFSVAYEGANGTTADEISSVFYLPAKEKLRSSIQTMQKYLNEENSEYEIINANALWVKQGFEIKNEFVETSKLYYDSKVDLASFPEDEKKINMWIEQKTNNKIKDLVSGTDASTMLVITNAIYFNGTWQTQFEESETHDDDFRVNKNTTISVPMMSIQATFPYTETDDLQILEMPYKGDRLSMFILLPKNDELASLETSLTLENLSNWQKSTVKQQVIVYIPKFKLEKEYDLIPSLKQLGIYAAFEDADFTNIADTELHISKALHKAFVDVNEQGTEAAAATEIEIMVGASPGQPPPSLIPVFRADHPFIFMIQDNKTGLVLFIGRVEIPA